MSIRKILVPIDFQEHSLGALKYAINLAKSTESKITCLYVIEELGFIAGLHVSKETHDKIRREAEIKLAEISNRVLQNEKIPFEIIITSGKVYKKIIDTAIELNVRFIIMGKSGSSNFKKNVMGTNINHIIAESGVPVITITAGQKQYIDHLLLPLDLTKPIHDKLEKSIDIARILNASITVLAVLKSDWIGVKLEFAKKLFKIKALFEHRNIACKTKLIKAKEPVSLIINKYAEEIMADMVFVMTQQEIDFVDYFIGSTAQEIINKSKLPVLTVIPGMEEDDLLLDHFFKSVIEPVKLSSTIKYIHRK